MSPTTLRPFEGLKENQESRDKMLSVVVAITSIKMSCLPLSICMINLRAGVVSDGPMFLLAITDVEE
jgi:hypothetical protein